MKFIYLPKNTYWILTLSDTAAAKARMKNFKKKIKWQKQKKKDLCVIWQKQTEIQANTFKRGP